MIIRRGGDKKIISYSSLLQHSNNIRRLKSLGFVLLPQRRSKTKKVIGYTCLVIGILPNGLGVVLIPLSLYLLGVSLVKIKNEIRRYFFMLKYKVKRWF